MQNINFDLKQAILQILAEDYRRDYTLKELTQIALPAYYNKIGFFDKELHETNDQTKVLNALLFLEKRGLIVLNSTKDECCITIKGYILSNLDSLDLS